MEIGSLPQRSWIKSLPKLPVITNQYHLQFKTELTCFKICQIKTKPQLESDSRKIYHDILKKNTEYFERKLNGRILSYRGNTVWVLARPQSQNDMSQTQKKGTQQSQRCVVTFKNQKEEILVKLKKVNEGKIYDLENRILLTQLLNCFVKHQAITKCSMKQLGRNIFYPKLELTIAEDDKTYVKAFLGYKFSVNITNQRMSLSIVNKIRVVSQINFLQTFHDEKKSADFYIGKCVMKNYGNNSTFQIDSLCFDKTPKSTFLYNEEEISYIDYYKRCYKKSIQNKNQFLIKCYTKYDYKINQKTKGDVKSKQNMATLKGTRQEIFLVPELVVLTGIPERASHKFMDRLRLDPNQDIQKKSQLIKDLNKQLQEKSGSEALYLKVGEPLSAEASLLDNPRIRFNKFNQIEATDGRFTLKGQLQSPVYLTNGVIMYSYCGETDHNEVEDCLLSLEDAGKRFKIDFTNVVYLGVKVNRKVTCKEWIKEIEKDIKQNSSYQILIIALKQQQTSLYPQLKSYLTRQKITSQFFLRHKILKSSKSRLKIAANIDLQIAAKLGKILWNVRIPNDKSVLQFGVSTMAQSKKKVSIINRNQSEDLCDTIHRVSLLESKQIPEELFEAEIKEGLKKLLRKKNIPQVIVIYRMGLNNELYTESAIEKQIEIAKKCIEIVKTKKANNVDLTGKLKLVYMKVISEPQMRFFEKESGNQAGTLLPNALNPRPGAILLGDSPNKFYLVSHNATIGIAKPTYYEVISNQGEVEMSWIATHTYAQCFNYFNWQGSVRLPGCLQYCKKLHSIEKPWLKENKQWIFENTTFI